MVDARVDTLCCTPPFVHDDLHRHHHDVHDADADGPLSCPAYPLHPLYDSSDGQPSSSSCVSTAVNIHSPPRAPLALAVSPPLPASSTLPSEHADERDARVAVSAIFPTAAVADAVSASASIPATAPASDSSSTTETTTTTTTTTTTLASAPPRLPAPLAANAEDVRVVGNDDDARLVGRSAAATTTTTATTMTTAKTTRVPLGQVVSCLVDKWSLEYLDAARAGDAESMCMVAQMYMDPEGWGAVHHDHAEGRRWLQRARDVGHHAEVRALERKLMVAMVQQPAQHAIQQPAQQPAVQQPLAVTRSAPPSDDQAVHSPPPCAPSSSQTSSSQTSSSQKSSSSSQKSLSQTSSPQQGRPQQEVAAATPQLGSLARLSSYVSAQWSGYWSSVSSSKESSRPNSPSGSASTIARSAPTAPNASSTSSASSTHSIRGSSPGLSLASLSLSSVLFGGDDSYDSTSSASVSSASLSSSYAAAMTSAAMMSAASPATTSKMVDSHPASSLLVSGTAPCSSAPVLTRAASCTDLQVQWMSPQQQQQQQLQQQQLQQHTLPHHLGGHLPRSRRHPYVREEDVGRG